MSQMDLKTLKIAFLRVFTSKFPQGENRQTPIISPLRQSLALLPHPHSKFCSAILASDLYLKDIRFAKIRGCKVLN